MKIIATLHWVPQPNSLSVQYVLLQTQNKTPGVRKVFLPRIDLNYWFLMYFMCEQTSYSQVNKFSMKWVKRHKCGLFKTFLFQNSGRRRGASLPCCHVAVLAVFCTPILSTAQEHRFQEKWPLAVIVILKAF